jgi:hypothetical protein
MKWCTIKILIYRWHPALRVYFKPAQIHYDEDIF